MRKGAIAALKDPQAAFGTKKGREPDLLQKGHGEVGIMKWVRNS